MASLDPSLLYCGEPVPIKATCFLALDSNNPKKQFHSTKGFSNQFVRSMQINPEYHGMFANQLDIPLPTTLKSHREGLCDDVTVGHDGNKKGRRFTASRVAAPKIVVLTS
eukprot:15341784-Ditylum_brightwellii.AAC.1